MRIFGLLVVFALVSCSSFPNPEQKPDKPLRSGLNTQELAAGECGIFLWTLASPPSFTFFHKNGNANAKLFLDGAEVIFQVPQANQAVPDYGSIQYEFRTDTKRPIVIKGQYGAVMEGGRKVPSGSIQVTNQDGWQEITPVSGVYACR